MVNIESSDSKRHVKIVAYRKNFNHTIPSSSPAISPSSSTPSGSLRIARPFDVVPSDNNTTGLASPLLAALNVL